MGGDPQLGSTMGGVCGMQEDLPRIDWVHTYMYVSLRN
jgi:hypothetical protein